MKVRDRQGRLNGVEVSSTTKRILWQLSARTGVGSAEQALGLFAPPTSATLSYVYHHRLPASAWTDVDVMSVLFLSQFYSNAGVG
jgi:hypothetical protein